MASHYQTHPGPSYYIDPQSNVNYTADQAYAYAPGPSAANPNQNVAMYPQYHPGMSSPRLNAGGARGTGYNLRGGNPRGHHPQSYAHPHQHPHPNAPNPSGYRPPYPQPQYPHPQMQPMQPIHPAASYVPVMYAPQPLQGNPWQQPQPTPPTTQHQLPKQDIPLASPLEVLTPLAAVPSPSASYSPTMSRDTGQTNLVQNQNIEAQPDASTETNHDSTSHSSHGDAEPAHKVARSASPSPVGSGGWVIWSRRPTNPMHAPGVIISPRARPPPVVVACATEEGTPPASPLEQTPPSESLEEREKAAEVLSTPAVEEKVAIEEESDAPEPDTSTHATTSASGTRTGTPATTVTTMTIPGSPLSSPKPTGVAEAQSRDAATTTAAAPTPAPTLAAPPPKKSWASLLRAPAPSSSSSPSPSTNAASTATANGAQKPKWNGLPTSSVVGFSVPAGADNINKSAEGKEEWASPAKRAALLALLNAPAQWLADPAADASAPAPSSSDVATQAQDVEGQVKIAPRGLVNTGNMCFANAVLQVLVYCAPFSALFGRMRGVVGTVRLRSMRGRLGRPRAGDRIMGMRPLLQPLQPLRGATEESWPRRRSCAPREPNGNGNGNGKKQGGGNGAAWGGKGKGRASPAEEEQEEQEAFIPTHVYDALKGKKRFDGMRGGHQEDAEEFLGFFLDTLEEELLAVGAALAPSSSSSASASAKRVNSNAGGRAVVEEREEEAPSEAEDGWLEVGKKNRTVVTRTIKTAESPITRIFGGRFRSTLRAPGQKDSVIVEDWRSLRLDIQRDGIHTIADALALISHPQTVQVSQPSRPGIVVDASQQILIDALPPILILHVKRFCYDTAVGGVVKVGKRVAFGPELEVGNDVMVPTARKQSSRYKLFGVVYHHGVSASGGHYTLDVLHPTRFPATSTGTAGEREGWVRIDDELVSDVRPADVFGAAEGDSRCAYLLFYRRVR
ncbi:hypothetical protein K438DRAFT_1815196 [Mycena galopus ATCC 62051]|nr:hypothetical protein K438DRAFT_1815196 [Mycena galopus ATCC 62051]